MTEKKEFRLNKVKKTDEIDMKTTLLDETKESPTKKYNIWKRQELGENRQ